MAPPTMEDQIAQVDGGEGQLACAGVLLYAARHPDEVGATVLFEAIGGAPYANRRLAANAVQVACALHAATLPERALDELPDPRNPFEEHEFDAAVRHVGLDTPGAFETVVCELRRRYIVTKYRTTAPIAGSVHPEDVCDRMSELLLQLAPQCKFERTGDWYIRACVRALLPARAVADLSAEEAPFRLVAEHLGRTESNEIVGRLFRTRVEDLLQQEKDPLSPVTLFLSAAIIAEYCDLDEVPVYSNIDVGDTALGVLLCRDFDLGAGHSTVLSVGASRPAAVHASVLDALVTWISADSRTPDFRAAVFSPETLNPDCAIAKIMTAKKDSTEE